MKLNVGRAFWSLLAPLALLSTPVLSANTLQICPDQSLVTIFVDREGGLSSFGHQHLVSIHTLTGEIGLKSPISESTAEIKAAFTDMRIDLPALRKAAGIEGTPSEKNISKTRRNMLEKVLVASQFPEVIINITGLKQQDQENQVALSSGVSLHGQTFMLEIPATLEFRENLIQAKGQFRLTQSNFGIKPFKALLGLLSVADELVVNFDVVAAKNCD